MGKSRKRFLGCFAVLLQPRLRSDYSLGWWTVHIVNGEFSVVTFGSIFRLLWQRTLDKGPKEPFFFFGMNVLITFKSVAGIQN